MSVRRPLVALVAAGLVLVTAPARADDAVPPAAFPVVGAGFGHAVGMSQWGAYGMAKAGFDVAGIVTHYYSGTTVTAVQDDMDVRINLLYQVASAKVRGEALDPTGGAVEVTVGAAVTVGGPADEFRFSVNGPAVAVQRVTDGVVTDLGVAPTVTVRWAGTRTPGAAPGGPTLLNVAGPSTSLGSSGHRYRFGYVEVVPVSTQGGNRLNVVNALRLHDEYLYGISEVSSSWPAAAMQAQVLASRTYALSKVARGVRQACSCHMDDGGGPYYDQTFTGWLKASSSKGGNWLDAVNATAAAPNAGLAILFEGKPISAFYSASSGGSTQAAKDVWGGSLAYAVSVPDPWALNDDNPDRSWTVNATQSQMAAAFGVGAVMKVEVTERFSSGAVRKVTATASDGSVITISGAKLQGALRLKSMFVTSISGSVGAALPTPAPAPTVVPAPAPVPEPVPAPAPTSPVKQRTVSLLTPLAITEGTGRRYKVVGVVRPAKAGLATWRQVLVDGVWKTKQRTRTNEKGRYRFVVKSPGDPGQTRTYRVLVVKKGNVVGVSAEFTVTAQP